MLLKRPDSPENYTPEPSLLARARTRLQAMRETVASQPGLRGGWQIVAFAVTALAIFSRSTSLFTHSQFYAEDGAIWFAQAYNLGWAHSLGLPQAGYLEIMPRLAAGLALLVPLRWAPLVMATVGLLVQALPVPILLSSRCHRWGGLPCRLLLAGLYVALPNAREIHIVATNMQWHLALAVLLIALADSPRIWPGRLFDIVLAFITALSGPFCILLAPMVLVFWWLRRQPWSLVIFAMSGCGALLQLSMLLYTSHRVQGVLGATPTAFVRMLGGNVIACALFGSYAFASIAPLAFLVTAAAGGLCIGLYCFRFATAEWRLFLVYCAGLYAASLRSPLTSGTKPAWDLLLIDNSARYWFFPMLAFVWSAVWCASYGRDRIFRLGGMLVLLLMSIGIVRDWRYAAYPDDHFAVSVQRMQTARAGDLVTLPVAPEGWQIQLVKKN